MNFWPVKLLAKQVETEAEIAIVCLAWEAARHSRLRSETL
jgi:hypothetical protein